MAVILGDVVNESIFMMECEQDELRKNNTCMYRLLSLCYVLEIRQGVIAFKKPGLLVYKTTLLPKHFPAKIFIGWNFCLLVKICHFHPLKSFTDKVFFLFKVFLFLFLFYEKNRLNKTISGELVHGSKYLLELWNQLILLKK